jgi:hypothetical protein
MSEHSLSHEDRNLIRHLIESNEENTTAMSAQTDALTTLATDIADTGDKIVAAAKALVGSGTGTGGGFTQADIDAAVAAQLATDQGAIDAANTTASASQTALSEAQAAAVAEQAAVQTTIDALSAEKDRLVAELAALGTTASVPPVDVPPAPPVDPAPPVTSAAPLFTFAGDPATVDGATWALADVIGLAADGVTTVPLYTYVGPAGANVDPAVWAIYTGATAPATAPPAA